MRYLSVCSGIEAASAAWHPLGWTPHAFSEIEAFPSAVLAHRYGSNLPGEPLSKNAPPNYGDMTKFKEWPDANVDVLVGGTPCQSFSVAGLRKGLADPRGNLCLTFLAIADKYRPTWVLWENVPGVLSSDGGRDFGAFLGGLGQLGYGWSYRVLDAQYVRVDGFARAVPQRRRRVFVVGYLGDWRRAAAVLFEREGMLGDNPPRRQAGQGTSADVVPSLVSSGRGVERSGETRGQDPVIAVPQISHCLNAGGMGRQDYETETMVAFEWQRGATQNLEMHEGFSPALIKSQTPAIAFSCKDHGADATEGVAPTMRAMGHAGSHANAGGQIAIAIQATTIGRSEVAGPNGPGHNSDGSCPTLRAEAGDNQLAVAFPIDTQNCSEGHNSGGKGFGEAGDPSFTLSKGHSHAVEVVSHNWAVRRLMPIECERLQGFPDGYTDVPYRGKQAADGPRYKALGNSMAVNVMRWIGMRIAMVDALSKKLA